jgi:hypothetical protein
MLSPPREAAYGIRLSMQCRRIVLGEVVDPLYARRRGNAGSAATSVSFALLPMSSVIRARDVPSSLSATVTVDGRHPVLLTAGSITCGRLFLRCKTIPIELGAGKNGCLALGKRVFINTGATVVTTHGIVVGC